MAQVSQKPDVHTWQSEQKSHRIISVVRNAEGIHLHIPNFERGARRKNAAIEGAFKLAFDRFASEPIAINRNFELPANRRQSLDMIGMLVRDQHSGQPFRPPPALAHPLST